METRSFIVSGCYIVEALLLVVMFLIPEACFRNPEPTIITTEIVDSSFTQVVIRSVIYSDGGSEILKSGVCWSTHPSPTTLDSYYENYEKAGVFINTLNGNPDSTFYVRSFAINGAGMSYSNEVSYFFWYPGSGINQPPIIQLDSPGDNSVYVPGEPIDITFTPYDPEGKIDRIEVFANDSLIVTLRNSSEYQWRDAIAGKFVISAKVFDNKGAVGYSNEVTITLMNGLPCDGIIAYMVRSEEDELIFGYNKTLNNLVLINPIRESLREIPLPYSKAIAMDYSIKDKKLYIIYQYTGMISIWDKETQTLSSIPYSPDIEATDLEVDSENRKIFILTNIGLFIIDMDSGSVLSTNSDIEGQILAIDPGRKLIFSSYNNSSPSSFYKYSVSSDTITLLETLITYNDYARGIEVNSLYNYVVLYGSVFSVFSEDNINELTGTIDIGVGAQNMIFTEDYKEILTYSSGEYIFLIDSKTFAQIRKIYFPYSDGYATLMTNFSGSKIAAFSYNFFDNNRFRIYFFDLLQ